MSRNHGRRAHVLRHLPRIQKPHKSRRLTADPTMQIGTPYSLEQIQTLVSSLASYRSELEIAAVKEFIDKNDDISEGIATHTEVSSKDFVELVIAASLRNQESLIEDMRSSADPKGLSFLANAEYLPESLRSEASEALSSLDDGTSAAPKTIFAGMGLIDMAPERISSLESGLSSSDAKEQVESAVAALEDLPSLEMARSHGDEKAKQVIEDAFDVVRSHPEESLMLLEEHGSVAAIHIVGAKAELSDYVRQEADSIGQELSARMDPSAIVHAHGEAKNSFASRVSAPSSPISELTGTAIERAEQIVRDLSCGDKVKEAEAAIGFFKDYDQLSNAISAMPDTNLSQASSLASKKISENLEDVMRSLEACRDMRSLEFLARSEKLSEEVRKRSEELYAKLASSFRSRPGMKGRLEKKPLPEKRPAPGPERDSGR